jgi:hypothetical protein
VISAISWLTMGMTFFPYIAFQDYFVFHRPRNPTPDRTYALFVHGTTVYLTPQEHMLTSNYWMAVFIICFLLFRVSRMDGDPFASKFGDVHAEVLPKSVLKPHRADSLSGAQIFLILAGYFVALLVLMVFLIVQAFR